MPIEPVPGRATGLSAIAISAAVAWLLMLDGAFAQSPVDENRPLPSDAALTPELVATGFADAQGLTFDEAGNLFVANYRELGSIGRITPEGAASIWCRLDQLAPLEGHQTIPAGLKMDRFDRLIVADRGGGRVLRVNPDGKSADVLADRCEGTRFEAINDVALDDGVNIYFTESAAGEPDGTGAVYRYDAATRQVRRLAEGLASPTGITVSPDQSQLCVAESARGRVLMFEIGPDGEVAKQRTLYAPSSLQPASAATLALGGLAFDAMGRLYVALASTGAISVVDVPSGQERRRYRAGGARVSHLHFHHRAMYAGVPDHEAVFRLPLQIEGFDYRKP